MGQWPATERSSPRLARGLTWFMAFAVGITAEVGTGIFYVSSQVQASDPGIKNGVPLALVLDGVVALVIAATYWFYSNTLAGTGGEYVYISRVVGPSVGFVANVISWFGVSAVDAFGAFVTASFLAPAVAPISPPLGAWFATKVGAFTTGLCILWLSCLLHYRGVRWVGRSLQIVTFIIAGTVGMLMLLGWTHTPMQLLQALHRETGLNGPALMHHTLKPIPLAFFKALPPLYLSYVGFRFVTFTGGETREDPRRVVGQAIILLVPLIVLLYWAFTTAVAHSVPWQLLSGLIAAKRASLANGPSLLGLFLPPPLRTALNLATAIIVLKGVVTGILVQSRLMLAFAVDDIIPPAFRRLSRFQTP